MSVNSYKGENLSAIVIQPLLTYLKKIEKNGLKKTIETAIFNFNLENFMLKKIKNQLAKRRKIELGKKLGSAFIQYRCGGIRIEPAGFLRYIFKSITVSNEQLFEILNNLIFQIEKKYIKQTEYVEKRADEIIFQLTETGVYKSETPDEKTLYDLILLILVDFHKITNEKDLPKWIETAMNDVGNGKLIKEWIEIILEQIPEIISEISKNLFFDFKITFDSKILRLILNKKTNRGQLYKLFKLIKLDIKKTIFTFSKNYISPSFTKGVGEIIRNFMVGFLFEINENLGLEVLNEKKENSGAFGVTLSFGENPTTSRAFRWFTKAEIKSGIIELSKTEDFKNSIKIKANHREVLKTVPSLNLGLITNFKLQNYSEFSAELSDLTEGEYYYKIICGGSEKISKFKIKNPKEGFKFTIFADPQGMIEDDYNIFLNVFEKAMNNGDKSDFVVNLGDFVDDGNNEEYWEWLLNSNLWMENAVVPLAGNHEALRNSLAVKHKLENSIVSHFNLKNLPKNQNLNCGAYFSFVYGAATFVVLNTNSQEEDTGIDKIQYKWALKTLKKAKTTWKIILTHKTPYSNGPHALDSDVKIVSNQIEILAYEGNVDLVFGGHDHVYVRTPSLALGQKVSDGNGTIFIIPGTSGVKNYKQNTKIDLPFEFMPTLNLPVFSEVEISENKIFFNSFTVNNSEIQKIDECVLMKNISNYNSIDGDAVHEYIKDIPEYPWVNHNLRLKKAFDMYNSLDYHEKLDVKNYPKLKNIKKTNENYNKILNGEIKTVKNKSEFLNAVSDPDVGTIVTDCNEITFENKFGRKNVVIVDRNLCIRGNAKLNFVKFIIKNNSMLLLADKVSIDNLRRPLSIYSKLPPFIAENGSQFFIKDKCTIFS